MCLRLWGSLLQGTHSQRHGLVSLLKQRCIIIGLGQSAPKDVQFYNMPRAVPRLAMMRSAAQLTDLQTANKQRGRQQLQTLLARACIDEEDVPHKQRRAGPSACRR